MILVLDRRLHLSPTSSPRVTRIDAKKGTLMTASQFSELFDQCKSLRAKAVRPANDANGANECKSAAAHGVFQTPCRWENAWNSEWQSWLFRVHSRYSRAFFDKPFSVSKLAATSVALLCPCSQLSVCFAKNVFDSFCSGHGNRQFAYVRVIRGLYCPVHSLR